MSKRNILQKVIEEYNELRSPYAKASLEKIKKNYFTVEFEGHFCESCCMDEYFLDLVYELDAEGVQAEFIEFQFIEGERFVARYKFVETK